MVDINLLISDFPVVLANALDRILFSRLYVQAESGTRLRSSARLDGVLVSAP